MKITKYFLSLILLSVYSCSSSYILELNNEKVIAVKAEGDSNIIAIISPYKEAIQSEMEKVISYTETNLNKNGNESKLGNFVTDLCLNYADADICVMNNGGLRTSIEKGPITIGKLYELMPFENELVVLELEKTEFIGLLNYITSRGGEPFSGMKIIMDSKYQLIEYSIDVDFENKKKVRVLTSDYLANGGDKMWFFKNIKQEKTGIKLRDAIIDYCSKNTHINIEIDGRIKIIKNDK